MKTISPTNPNAFIVLFRDLDRWSVGSFIKLDWNWPVGVVRSLSTALRRKQLAVQGAVKPEELPLVTLHFDGNMEPRGKRGAQVVKGRLWWADPGDVVYSKIDVRNGAIGIVPSALGRICVTSEYPVYAVDPNVATAQYIRLLFRTESFRRKINGMISGASGRKRVQPENLETIQVPLPPLSTQESIVRAWETEQAEIADIWRRVYELEKEIEANFLAALGVASLRQSTTPKAFAVWWKELERWSVTFNQLMATSIDVDSGTYPVAALGDIAVVTYGIQKSPLNRPGVHARPYLRVANVQQGEVDLSEMKFINVLDAEMPSYRLAYGDLLVCEGNSAELVGRPAIWRDQIPDCVHQNHILKVRLDRKKAIPEFVLEYMQTYPARNYFRSRAKFTTNLASINSNDLREMPLPLPPLAVQQALMSEAMKQRKEIALLKAAADRHARQSRIDIEAMIRGEY